MGHLVEFDLIDGSTVLVRLDVAPGSAVVRGRADQALVERARCTFEEAIAKVQPAAQAIVDRFRFAADAPDEVEVEFGVELNAEAGALIATLSGSANFKVSMRWRPAASAVPGGPRVTSSR